MTARRRQRVPGVPGGAPAARAGRPVAEDGMTLVELMISSAVLLIVLSMTTVIVAMVTHQSSTQLNQGQATETAQISLSGLGQFVQGAVSPLGAYKAQQGNAADGTYPSSSAGLCWDETYPGPSTSLQSPLIADQNASGTVMVDYGGSTVKAVDPSTLSIIYAHDYDLELCSYPPGSTTPQVYEIYLDPGTCSDAAYGYCTVYVVRYTPTSSGACSSWANLYHDPTGPCASVVDQVPDVWCDAACHVDAVTQATGQTTYDSCWSYLPGSQPVPAWCTGVSPSNESSFTPPLFQYYGASGAGGLPINSAKEPMDLYCTSSGGVCSATSSTDDAPNLANAGIQSVEVDLTVLAAPGSTPPPGHKVSPGTTVSAYLPLRNLGA